MKRRILVSLLIVGLFLLTACGSNTNKQNTSKKPEKGNCTALECIKKLTIDNSVDDINKVIGFKGKLTDEKENKYEWEIGKNDKIIATYSTGDKATIEAKYSVDDIKNKKIDFSNYSEIQGLLKDGTSITYEDFNKKVNGEGYLYYISPSNTKYVWVNGEGEYLNGNFSNSTKKCTFVTGRIVKK